MDKLQTVTQSEWHIMELLWESPRTLMELVNILEETQGWAKSTVTTMARRMDTKGFITYETQGRTKTFHPAVSREETVLRETDSLLRKAYNSSLGMMLSAMVQHNKLSKSDIEELYAILKEAEAKEQ